MSNDIQEEGIREHKVKVLIQEPKAMAKQRLMDFAASLPLQRDEDYNDIPGTEVTYAELIKRATAYQQGGHYWSEGDRFEGEGLYDGFWDDYALVTQLPVTNTWDFFSCFC